MKKKYNKLSCPCIGKQKLDRKFTFSKQKFKFGIEKCAKQIINSQIFEQLPHAYYKNWLDQEIVFFFKYFYFYFEALHTSIL